jgi:hypothetical protein
VSGSDGEHYRLIGACLALKAKFTPEEIHMCLDQDERGPHHFFSVTAPLSGTYTHANKVEQPNIAANGEVFSFSMDRWNADSTTPPSGILKKDEFALSNKEGVAREWQHNTRCVSFTQYLKDKTFIQHIPRPNSSKNETRSASDAANSTGSSNPSSTTSSESPFVVIEPRNPVTRSSDTDANSGSNSE